MNLKAPLLLSAITIIILSFLLSWANAAKTTEPAIDYYAEEKAKQTLELATQLAEHHVYQDALVEALKIPTIYSQTAKVPDALFLIGTIHADSANFNYNPALAIQTWQQLVDRYPQYAKSPQALMLIAHNWEALEDWQHAILVYDQITARYPQNILVEDALLGSSIAAFKLNRYGEAKAKLELLINRFSEGKDDSTKNNRMFIDDALVLVADISFFLQDTTSAMAAWKRIVERYPESPYRLLALFQLGKIYQETYNQPVYALPYYQKIIEYTFNPTWQRLARIKIDQCQKSK